MKMKNGASVVLKQILALLTSAAKTKSMAVKNKTSALRTWILMLSLLRNKKVLLHSISEKIHSILAGGEEKDGAAPAAGDQQTELAVAVVEYRSPSRRTASASYHHELPAEREEEDNGGKYPELTHSLFEEEYQQEEDPEVDMMMRGGSIIDMVKNGKEEFRLEDEIDHVADLFITRFHKQMRMQKLLSFKRYQEMLQRSL